MIMSTVALSRSTNSFVSAKHQRLFKVIEKDYGADHLDLVLAKGYVSRLLSNARAVGYMAQCHPEILAEFQKLRETQAAA